MRLGVFSTLDYHPELQQSAGYVLRQAVAEGEMAERAGLESLWVAEHHFSPYGVCPDPAVLLAAVAARTRRLRLGTATAVLPLRNALQVAETYAAVDQLSEGRLEFGAGTGYLTYEFAGFGVPEGERRERFDEALDVVRLAWSGRPVRFTGKHVRIDAPPLNVLPMAAAGPPIHVGLTRPEGAPHVGRRGLRLAVVPYIALRDLADVAGIARAYRAELPPGASGEVTIALHAFCGDTPWRGAGDPRYAGAEAALHRYLRTRAVPGARYTGTPIPAAFVLFGDGEQLAERLRAVAAAGVDRVLLLSSFGGLPPEDVAASLRRAGALAAAL